MLRTIYSTTSRAHPFGFESFGSWPLHIEAVHAFGGGPLHPLSTRGNSHTIITYLPKTSLLTGDATDAAAATTAASVAGKLAVIADEKAPKASSGVFNFGGRITCQLRVDRLHDDDDNDL